MTDFKPYRSKMILELRPYVPGESMTGISLFSEDVATGSPREGDMIARKPESPEVCWLMSKAYFEANFST